MTFLLHIHTPVAISSEIKNKIIIKGRKVFQFFCILDHNVIKLSKKKKTPNLHPLLQYINLGLVNRTSIHISINIWAQNRRKGDWGPSMSLVVGIR